MVRGAGHISRGDDLPRTRPITTIMPEAAATQDPPRGVADIERRRAVVERVAARVLDFPRPLKRALAVGMDCCFCALAVYIAFYLRLDQWTTLRGLEWLAVIVSIFLAIPIFIVSGLYRAIFRYAGVVAMISIVQAALVYGVLYAAIITIIQIDTIPRTVGLIQPVVLFLLVAASRAATAWALGGAYMRLINPGKRKAVMIYGAGSAGRQLHQALGSSDMRVMGFIDDAEALQGQLMMGQPVYSPAEIEALVEKHELTDILLAIPSVSRKRRTQILELIRPLGVAIRTVPGVDDVARGRV
ncbi:MAG: polysaccharide biosynthesis protein, partial [Sphingomonadales bacterium]